MSRTADFLVVGGGIVGLTIALELRRRLGGRVLVLEKESATGLHASGRNSGVLHAGIYYPPGSLKSRLCVEGNRAWRDYCRDRKLPINTNGKLLVPVRPADLPRLEEIESRATRAGVPVRSLDESELSRYEPSARSNGRALWVESTAVTDPKQLVRSITSDCRQAGVEILCAERWQGLEHGNVARTDHERISFGHVINCAGVYADRIARQFGVGSEYTIMAFRGSYFRLSVDSAVKVNGNIYPVPDLGFPFLGPHFTTHTDGITYVGPTALPLAGREQYLGWRGVRSGDILESSRTLVRLMSRRPSRYLGFAMAELVSSTKYGFYRQARSIVQGLDRQDLESSEKRAIRAQLVNRRTWELVNDFVVEDRPNSTHVLNAVSPAFTCAIPFARYVVDRMAMSNHRPS